jgi:hypothetical protein
MDEQLLRNPHKEGLRSGDLGTVNDNETKHREKDEAERSKISRIWVAKTQSEKCNRIVLVFTKYR